MSGPPEFGIFCSLCENAVRKITDLLAKPQCIELVYKKHAFSTHNMVNNVHKILVVAFEFTGAVGSLKNNFFGGTRCEKDSNMIPMSTSLNNTFCIVVFLIY